MSLLQPMNGDVAVGAATIAALSGTVVLKKNQYLIPVVNNRALPECLFKVTADTTITTSPTEFNVKSLLGHSDHNLPAGTKMLMDPPVDGLPEFATVSTATTGAVLYTGFGSVKSIKLYESIPAGDLNDSQFKSDSGNTPALILTWMGSGESDPAGRGVAHMEDRWMLYAISSRSTSDSSRRAEGLYILDEATEWLFDRSHVDGECFSSPANLEVGGRDRLTINPTTYAYTLSFRTQRTVQKRDRRTFPQWSQTNLLGSTNTRGIINLGPPVPTVDVSVTIPQ